jgi:predicted 3-demethylubiquinone-9 3-methyltransferase (glyoxalase superfamily)
LNRCRELVVEKSGAEATRVFAAMMEMGKIDIAKIEASRCG